ncbi:MAG: porin family protein [Gammaproteobacteria bacterium]|nr:porin family protein [Gammaproteobacteria bacterium]
MKRLSSIITACVLTTSVSMSHAGGYIGASIGQTDIDVPGFDDANSLAIYGGYKVNKNFALELSYVDLGESEDDFAPVWTVEVDGINFSAVGIFPASEQVDLFGKVGMYMWDISVSEAGFGEFYSEDGTDLSFGFGAAINLTEQFALVFEYQMFDVDDEDMTNISLGARLNF